MSVEVVEYTDHGCVWSWGSEPKLRELRRRLGERANWRRVLGIQVEQADPSVDPEEVRAGWLEISAHTGAPVPLSLEWVGRSSRPGSYAVKAAELQGEELASLVLRRLREATFVDGQPADTTERIAAALAGLPGLDLERLLEDSRSDEVAAALARDWEETRRPVDAVLGLTGPGPNPGAARQDGQRVRYGFPTLILRGPEGERVVPGWRPLDEYLAAAEAVAPGSVSNGAPLDAASALSAYRSLSDVDLDVIAGGADPPEDAVRVETATGPVWLARDEAAVRLTVSAVGSEHGG